MASLFVGLMKAVSMVVLKPPERPEIVLKPSPKEVSSKEKEVVPEPVRPPVKKVVKRNPPRTDSFQKPKRLPAQSEALTLPRLGTVLRRLPKRGSRSPVVMLRRGTIQFEQSGMILLVNALPVTGESQGEILLRDLLSVLKGLNEDAVVTLDNGKAVFEGNGRSRTVVLDAVTNDEPSEWEGKWIPAEGLGPFLNRAVAFTEDSGSRYALSVIHMEEQGEIVATTGKLLIVLQSPVRLPLATFRFPASKFYWAREIESLQAISVSHGRVALRGPNWLLIMNEEQRPFPKWRDVFPKGGCEHVILDPDVLSALIAECKIRQEHTLFEFTGRSLRMSSKDFSAVEVPCVSEQPWKVMLDPELFQVVLRESIQRLHYFGNDKPLLCTGEGFKILIMPVSM